MVVGYQTALCCSGAKSCPTPRDPVDQGPPTFTITQSLLRFMSIQSVVLSNHLILRCPLLLSPSIFPSIRSFPMSQLFAWGSQSIGASASVLPMNNGDWFPLGLTGLISLLSEGLKNLLQQHSLEASIRPCSAFFMVQLSYFYMTTGKNHVWLYGPLSAEWCVCFLIHCLGLS